MLDYDYFISIKYFADEKCHLSIAVYANHSL